MEMHVFWLWFAGALTLAIFSFLYKDNPFYRSAEQLYVGVSNGYMITLIWFNVVVPMIFTPLKGALSALFSGNISWSLLSPDSPANFFVLLPAFIGLLYVARFFPKFAWLIRIPIGATMGYFVALAIPAILQTEIIKQIEYGVLTTEKFSTLYSSFKAILVFVGTIATLIYFFFSTEHKGPLRVLSQTGIIFIMVGFGASFGLTVMGRVALAIGRFIFIFKDWLGFVS